jgi:hypothetical protein
VFNYHIETAGKILISDQQFSLQPRGGERDASDGIISCASCDRAASVYKHIYIYIYILCAEVQIYKRLALINQNSDGVNIAGEHIAGLRGLSFNAIFRRRIYTLQDANLLFKTRGGSHNYTRAQLCFAKQPCSGKHMIRPHEYSSSGAKTEVARTLDFFKAKSAACSSSSPAAPL